MKKNHTLLSILVAAIMLTGCGTATDTTISSGKEATRTSSTITTAETTTSTTTGTTRTTTSTTTTTTTTSTTTTMQTATTVPVTEPEPQPEPVVETPVYTEEVNYNYSDSDTVLLAMLIHHEASGTWEGKMGVGNCVINRMNNWGMSLSGVIYQPYQFTVASYMYTYTDTDYQVASQLLSGGATDTRIMYFDGGHGGVNWFYDSSHNYLFAA